MSSFLGGRQSKSRLLIYIPLKDELQYLHLLTDFSLELYVPRISADSMQFYRCDLSSILSGSLESGPYGLKFPPAAARQLTLPLNSDDLVLIPALGVNKNGYRLGRGKGFYDRWREHLAPPRRLALLPQRLTALSFEEEAHDLQITDLIHEGGSWQLLSRQPSALSP